MMEIKELFIKKGVLYPKEEKEIIDDGIYTFEDKDWNKEFKTKEYKETLSFRGKILNARQNMPLDLKIIFAQNRIREVVNKYGVDNCVIGFSGGKDSSVLSHISLQMGYKIDHYYINTRLEYPECVSFAKRWCDENKLKLLTMFPDMLPLEVWKKFGYPMFSKEISCILERLRLKQYVGEKKIKKIKSFIKYKNVFLSDKCCDYLKKKPTIKFFKQNNKKVSILGTTAEESMIRRVNWIRKGCIYESKGQVICNPIIFFTEKDIYDYAKKFNIRFAEIYYKGIKRNGCFCCGFGCHIAEENNFKVLERLYPDLFNNIMDKWGFKEICKQCDVKINKIDIEQKTLT